MQNNLLYYNPGCSLYCESYALRQDVLSSLIVFPSCPVLAEENRFEEKGVVCRPFHSLEDYTKISGGNINCKNNV